MILDASLTDATEVVLPCLYVRLESWQCPIPTFCIFLAAFSSRSCSVHTFNLKKSRSRRTGLESHSFLSIGASFWGKVWVVHGQIFFVHRLWFPVSSTFLLCVKRASQRGKEFNIGCFCPILIFSGLSRSIGWIDGDSKKIWKCIFVLGILGTRTRDRIRRMPTPRLV